MIFREVRDSGELAKVCPSLSTKQNGHSLLPLLPSLSPVQTPELQQKIGKEAKGERRLAGAGQPTHRIRFVYLPRHSSWLNQIEIIFGVSRRRVMRHGNFTSKADLIEKFQQFITYFNRTIAQPINWTDTDCPTRNTPTPRPRTWRELRATAKPCNELALVKRKL